MDIQLESIIGPLVTSALMFLFNPGLSWIINAGNKEYLGFNIFLEHLFLCIIIIISCYIASK